MTYNLQATAQQNQNDNMKNNNLKNDNMKNDKRYLKSYINYLKKYPLILGSGLLLIPCLAFFHLAQPLLIKQGIDQFMLKQSDGTFMTICILFGSAVLAEFLCKSIQSYLFQLLGQKTVTDIRADLFRHVLSLSSSYFDHTPKGTIITRLTSDMESLSESFASGLVTLISDIIIIIGILIVMFFLSVKLTLVTLLLVPILFIVVNFFRIKLRHYYNKIRNATAKLNSILQEELSGMRIIQLFQYEKRSLKQFKESNLFYRKAVISSVSYDAVLYSLVESMSSITIACIIWYGWGQHSQSALTLGVLVAFIDYIQKFFTPLKELSTKFAVLQQALSALEKIFGTFDIKDHIHSGNKIPEKLSGDISFNNVSFAYKGYEDKPILHNVSFDMKPGQVVAIVGPTGSGKSTIIRLLNRLYENYEGQIHCDGHEIDAYDLHFLRSQMAIVNQDIQLFSQSINFNISMGNPTINNETIIEAAKLAQAHGFIESLPDGYDTILEQHGQQLSKGQAQLISLARAIACPAPIILLDEATASIDSLSEKYIQAGLESLFKKKSVLVVAHRLSTIQKADRILALKQGRIIESGTHQELMKLNGFYATLFNMQFSEGRLN